MKMRNLKYFTALFVLFFLFSCNDSDDPINSKKRTIIAYLVGGNNGGSINTSLKDNIKDLEDAMNREDCNLVVYFEETGKDPRLFSIDYSRKEGKGVQNLIATYPEDRAGDPATLNRVLKEVKKMFPADSYGLILGSHGTGWVPKDASFPGATRSGDQLHESTPLTRTFGTDRYNQEMEIVDLAAAIDGGYEFILFDACMMSCIEIQYELRKKAKYIISSPAEIASKGFPYKNVLKHLWGGEQDMVKVGEAYYNYYATGFGSISVVRTAGLEDLYYLCNQVLSGKQGTVAGFTKDQVYSYPLINIKYRIFYDLRDYMKIAASAEAFSAFEKQLEKTVLYQKITANFHTSSVDTEKCCGLSTYIPRSDWNRMNTYYFDLGWAGIYD